MIQRTMILFCLCVISFGLLAANVVGAETTSPPSAAFVDIDGDGINDNVPDANFDGIPDNPATSLSMVANESALGDVFAVGKYAAPSIEEYQSCCQKFSALKFSARSLVQHRIGFVSGDQFGPGNGIGASASSGGCAGGVCH